MIFKAGAQDAKVIKERIVYAAPRLKRDELRHDGQENLESVLWLQPMMKALGLPETCQQDFANCRVTLQPEKQKSRHGRQQVQSYKIQLTFPVEVNPDAIICSIGKAALWNRQFNLYPERTSFYSASLRWPHEKQPAKAQVAWNDQIDMFRCLATDLGQRDAGAFARLVASCTGDLNKKPSRFIGETNDKQWRAAVERTGLLRLPGEDARIWRAISENDTQKEGDSGKPFDFREELWGERGRMARDWEKDDTADLMRLLEVPPEDKNLTLLVDNWRDELTFPEQNDKLLIAIRRYQSRIARLHRWCWLLQGDEKQRQTAWEEIRECEDNRLISSEQRTGAAKRDPRLIGELEFELRERLKIVQERLVRIANRILPLRGRSWAWEKHPQATAKNPLHHLTQNGPNLDSPDRPVWIRGQRGLSLRRIDALFFYIVELFEQIGTWVLYGFVSSDGRFPAYFSRHLRSQAPSQCRAHHGRLRLPRSILGLPVSAR